MNADVLMSDPNSRQLPRVSISLSRGPRCALAVLLLLTAAWCAPGAASATDVTTVAVVDDHTVNVTYSASMDLASATTAANYTLTLTGGAGILTPTPDSVTSVGGGTNRYTLVWNSGAMSDMQNVSVTSSALDASEAALGIATGSAGNTGIGPPLVLSVLPIDANPTTASSVRFQVTFDKAVDFSGTLPLVLTGTATGTAPTSTAVTGAGTAVLIVTVSGVSGVGTLALSIPSSTIVDHAFNEDNLLTGSWAPAFTSNAYSINLPATSVTSVTAGVADGTYLVGAVITFQVGFSGPVFATGPTLILQHATNGGSPVTVSTVSGSGTSSLTFTYTVQPGDTSAGLAIGVTGMGGGAITDAQGNAVLLTPFPALADRTIIVQNAFITVADGAWGTGSTWQGGAAPGAGNDVVIANQVTLGAAETCTSITFPGTGTPSISGGSALTITTGMITIASGGTATISSPITASQMQINGGTLAVTTNLPTMPVLLDGNLDISTISPATITLAAAVHSGSLKLGANATIQIAAAGSATLGGSISGAATSLILSSGTLILAGADNSYAGSTEVMGSASLELRGDTGVLTATSQITIDALALFAITKVGVTDATLNPNRIPDNCPIYLNGGTLSMTSPNNSSYSEVVGGIVLGGNVRSFINLNASGTGTCQLTANGAPQGVSVASGTSSTLTVTYTGSSNLFASGYSDGAQVPAVTVGTTNPAIYQVANGFVTGLATATTKQDGNWSDASTWVGSIVPSSSDTVIIRHQVAYDTDFSQVNGVTFDNSGGGTPRLYVEANTTSTGDIPYLWLPGGGVVSCTIGTTATSEGMSYYASDGPITFFVDRGGSLTCEGSQIAQTPTTTNGNTFITGSLTKTGTGTLTFDIANTQNISEFDAQYNFDLIVQAGNFTIRNPLSVPSGVSGSPFHSVSVGAGAVFSLGNSTTYSYSGLLGVSGTGGTVTGTATPNSSLVLTANVTNFPGAITGNLDLTFQGSATLSGTAANTYSGHTTISAGTLTIAKGGSQGLGGTALPAGSAPVVIMATGTALALSGNQILHSLSMADGTCSISTTGQLALEYASAGTPWAGPLSGSGGLTVESGPLTLQAAATYSGPTVVAAGASLLVQGGLAPLTDLTISGSIAFSAAQSVDSLQGSGGVSIATGTLTIANGLGLTFSGAVSGNGGLVLTGTTPWIFAGTSPNSYLGQTLIGPSATLTIASPTTANAIPANGQLTLDGTFDLHGCPQSVAILQGPASGLIINSAIGGSAPILTVTGTSLFHGRITGQVALAVSGSGTTVQLTQQQSYSGNTAVAAGATLNLNGFNQTLSGLTGGGTVTVPNHTLTLSIPAGPADTFAGALQGTMGLVASGPGTLIVTGGANTFRGPTQVTGGTLEVSGATAILGQSNAQIDVLAGATLALANSAQLPVTQPISLAGTIMSADASHTQVNGPITVTAPAVLQCDSGILTIAGTVTGSTLLTLTGAAGSGQISAGLALGSAGLLKLGSGSWTLNGAQAYSGSTEVAAGLLIVPGSIAGSAQVQVDPAGTFVAAASQQIQALIGSGSVTLSPAVVLTLASPAGPASVFAGTISGPGGIAEAGPGIQEFSGANVYGGGTSILAGTLALDLGGTFGGATAAVVVDGGGSLRLDGGIEIPAGQTITLAGGTIQGFSGSNTILAPITLSANSAIDAGLAGTSNGLQINGPVALGTSILSLIGTSTSADAINGVISDNGGGIDMAGTGSWNITAVNAYSGSTVIDSGTLVITGLIPGDATVNGAGTLAGTGIVLGTVTANGAATINPGTAGSVGTLTFGNLVTLPSNSLVFSVGSVSDLIQIAGPYTANGNVVIVPGGQFAPGTYTLVTSSGLMTLGTLTPAVLSIVSGGTTYAAFLQVVNNALQLVVDDGSAPQVTQISTDVGSGTYYWQQVINITITFNKPVQLSGGDLYLTLNSQAQPAPSPVAVQTTSSLSANLVGVYTVQLFDWTPKLNVLALTLQAGATLRNFANKDAILTLPPPSGSYASLASQQVLVIDNQAPTISVNNTLNLPIHTIAPIDATVLSASDFETPNQLTYTLISPPSQGVLQLQVSPGTWQDVASSAPGNTWQQTDIVNGNLRYLHNGANSGNDIFFFTVTDVFIANSDGLSKAKTTPFTPFRIVALGVPPPVVSPFNANLVFEQNSTTPIPIAASNDIIADSATTVLNPGSLVVTLDNATSDDHLSLDVSGLVTLSGSTVLVGGNPVGTYTSGDVSGATPLVITLSTANATVTSTGGGAMTTLLQNIMYAYLGNDPSNVPLRTVTVVVSDLATSGGGASLSYSKTISIDPYNNPPLFVEIQGVSIPGTSTAAPVLAPASLANPALATTNANVTLTLMATFTDVESTAPSNVQLSGVGSVNPDGSITTTAGGIVRLISAPSGPSPLSAPPPPNPWQVWLQYTPPLNQSGLADTFTITATDAALPPLAGITTDLTRVQARSVSQLITVAIGTLNDAAAPLIVSNPPLEAQTGANLNVPIYVGTVGAPTPATLTFSVVGASPPPGIQITIQAVSGGNQLTLFWPAPLMPTSQTVYDFSIQVFDSTTGKSSVQPILLLLHGIPSGGG